MFISNVQFQKIYIFFSSLEASLNFLKSPELCGQWLSEKNYKVFYGCGQSYSSKSLPHQAFRLVQVHGSHIVKASSATCEADGHYTTEKHRPIAIKTADCMPVFFADDDRVVALHIGWRGLEQKILSHYVQTLGKKIFNSKLFIGPHIQQDSFELDIGNAENLLKAHNISWNRANELNIIEISNKRAAHVRISLQKILTFEAKSLGFADISCSPIDTYRSSRHFSYRRNPWQLGRNYSFIVKV